LTATQKQKSNLRGEKRRQLILDALHDCVIKKGYAKTTLADIAEAADMYPSHLLYYYNGKEAVLHHFFQNVSERIATRISDLSSESPREQIRLIADLFFAGASISKSEIGFMLECFGVAVGDKVLRREKSEMDQQCKAYFTELFKQTPGGLIPSSADAAEVAYANLIGLRSAVYFDDKLSLHEAHRLFLSSMLAIAGLLPER
jgi:AcrR family transcriptional regulator